MAFKPCGLLWLLGYGFVGILRTGDAGFLQEAAQDSEGVGLILF